jgi:hypothetical protein
MKFSKVIGMFVAIVMLMGGATMASAGDACQKVKFQFKNERPVTIRVTKVEYLNKANNKTQTEDINPNMVCPPGLTCTTDGDDLRDAEGEDLTNFVFFFNDRESDGDWSKGDIKTQNKVPVNQKCSADRTYSGSPVWTINP